MKNTDPQIEYQLEEVQYQGCASEFFIVKIKTFPKSWWREVWDLPAKIERHETFLPFARNRGEAQKLFDIEKEEILKAAGMETSRKVIASFKLEEDPND